MQIECRQEHLTRALHLVGRMVGTRGTLPVLGNILLATDKGRLKLAATDLEVGVQTWIGGKVEEEGSLTIPARLLIDFVTNNSDSTLVLKSTDSKLHLSSEHYNANIHGIDASEFPLIPDIERTKAISLPAKDLKEAIIQTVFATAIDETRPVLTGVFVKIDQSTLKLAATDSYRLAERTLPLSQPHPTFQAIIPARTLQELARMLTDDKLEVQLYFAENQVLFTFGETEFISRLIDGNFPDYEQIIPKTTTTEVRLQKTTFGAVMKMASLFARESANNVQLHVKDGAGLEVTAISPQLGDTISKVSADVTGEPVEIAFNAKFILDALSIFPGDDLQLVLSGKLQPGILRPMSQKDYLYLIMPLRVDA